MLNWKLYRWHGADEREELTQYLTAPVFLETKCNEELSTGQVTLDNMPTSTYNEPFYPKTKLTIERWAGDTLATYYDFLVDHDDVEHYAGMPEACCHRVHLIEASVFAQGLHCDNFSLTYELNDVTLNYKTVVSQETPTNISSNTRAGSGYTRPSWSYGGTPLPPAGVGDSWFRPTTGSDSDSSVTEYTNSFIYEWEGLEVLNRQQNINGLVSHNISFQMPILKCHANDDQYGTRRFLFNCPVRCVVTRTTLTNNTPVNGSTVQVASVLYSPTGVAGMLSNDRLMYNSGGLAGIRGTWTGSFTEDVEGAPSVGYQIKVFRTTQITNLPAMINTNNTSNSSRTVSFNTTALTTQEFALLRSYRYNIVIMIEPYQSGAIILQYTARTETQKRGGWFQAGAIYGYVNDFVITYPNYVSENPSAFTASTDFVCRDLTEPAPSLPFTKKGRPYNCLDLFRKAMLTCDTRVFSNAPSGIGLDEKWDSSFNDIGIQYPIAVHTDWIQKLKSTIMHESIFEGKNLWEVMQQIGYYIHAIPYLEFARDGKDRFVLRFKQLGGTNRGNDDSIKITVFNSRALDGFFTQYDSYVTNIFSPQNEVEEWLVCKTSEASFLISNETAEIHTKWNIVELLEFDITYNGVTKSALDHVFEKTIYDTMSARDSIIPGKWTSLYFEMGTSKILGLNYVPPTANNDGYMALKTIAGMLFSNSVTNANLKFNDLRFRIKYKTQDAMRITQVRPDLERFMKNSEFENYPRNEQFFNPQDKIVDSERFSANLWGRLIRVANGVYQRQECATTMLEEKTPGDLIDIKRDSYYITVCENEYYDDVTFQKVTYSMNFNQLSNIVTIPSEPRFFEISERSMIRREVRLLDFVKLSTAPNASAPAPRYINTSMWHGFIRSLFFADGGNAQLPNCAYTNFKADIHRTHELVNFDIATMFPSSDVRIDQSGVWQPIINTQNRAVIVPVMQMPMRNAIILEWDMADNFKAGDSMDTTVPNYPNITADKAYYNMQPVRYTDIFGRADLFDFKLFYKNNWTNPQEKRLPFADAGDFQPTAAQSLVLIPDNLSIGLDKDNREALSFNYQLSLLHEPHSNDSEDFSVFANLFGRKNGRLKVALLSNEVSMFDEAIRMDATNIIAGDVAYSFVNLANSLQINFTTPGGINLNEVKSIVVYDTENTNRYVYIAKNVALLPSAERLKSWYMYPMYSA